MGLTRLFRLQREMKELGGQMPEMATDATVIIFISSTPLLTYLL